MRQIRKVEMVDAWTQTSNRGSSTEVPTKKESKKDTTITTNSTIQQQELKPLKGTKPSGLEQIINGNSESR